MPRKAASVKENKAENVVHEQKESTKTMTKRGKKKADSKVEDGTSAEDFTVDIKESLLNGIKEKSVEDSEIIDNHNSDDHSDKNVELETKVAAKRGKKRNESKLKQKNIVDNNLDANNEGQVSDGNTVLKKGKQKGSKKNESDTDNKNYLDSNPCRENIPKTEVNDDVPNSTENKNKQRKRRAKNYEDSKEEMTSSPVVDDIKESGDGNEYVSQKKLGRKETGASAVEDKHLSSKELDPFKQANDENQESVGKGRKQNKRGKQTRSKIADDSVSSAVEAGTDEPEMINKDEEEHVSGKGNKQKKKKVENNPITGLEERDSKKSTVKKSKGRSGKIEKNNSQTSAADEKNLETVVEEMEESETDNPKRKGAKRGAKVKQENIVEEDTSKAGNSSAGGRKRKNESDSTLKLVEDCIKEFMKPKTKKSKTKKERQPDTEGNSKQLTVVLERDASIEKNIEEIKSLENNEPLVKKGAGKVAAGKNKGGSKGKRKQNTEDDKKDDETKPAKVPKENAGSKSPSKKEIPDVNNLDFGNSSTSLKGKSWNLKLASWNVNGIRAWLEKNGLSYLHHEKPDIMCVQETKCSDDKLPEGMKNIDGYHAYWLAGDKDGYSGVGLISKQKPIDVKFGIGIDEHDKEGRVITAEYDKYFVVATYVPNAGRGLVRLDYRMQWDKDFRAYLKKLDEKKPVVLCGDLNVAHKEIDLANPKTNKKSAGFTKEEREGFSTLLEEGFIDTFRHLYPDAKAAYTFWTYMMNARAKNVGWRLDYFVISERFVDFLCDSVIRKDVFGSDHCPVVLFLSV